jgi:hypothetical protein
MRQFEKSVPVAFSICHKDLNVSFVSGVFDFGSAETLSAMNDQNLV